MLTTFRTSDEKLYLLGATNDTHFNGRQAVYTNPTAGNGVRDPSIFHHTDGFWYVAHTDVSASTYAGGTFAVLRSPDRQTWTKIADVAPLVGATFVWSPEWFVDDDGSVHILVAATTGADFASATFGIYEVNPTNAGLTAWSTGTPLTGTSLPNAIDPSVIKVGSTYHAFPKNETTKHVEHWTSTSLTSGWTRAGTGDWAGWGTDLEGASIRSLPGGGYRITFDKYTGVGPGIYHSDSTDLATWTPKALVLTSPFSDFRHGTTIAI